MIRRSILVLAVVLSAACTKEYFSGPTGPIDPATQTFATALGVDLAASTKTASGLYYRDKVVGTGPQPAAGDTVYVRYAGYLADGLRFDFLGPNDDPLKFKLGVNAVIRGFEEGITTMRVGGQRQLVIPSGLAYGSQPRQNIPAFSNLVFDVELVAVKTPTTP